MPHKIGPSLRPRQTARFAPESRDSALAIPRVHPILHVQEKCGLNRILEAQTRQKPKKIGQFPENPKKTVEIGCFSIDFSHLEAAL
jgi:hypothetical protein